MDHSPRLKVGKIYAAETISKNIYIGKYKGFYRDPQFGCIGYYALDSATNYHYSFWSKETKPEKLRGEVCFKPTDTFYDLEEIRDNGQRARQNMEQRSLDMILKQLVNEHFEWK
jgi:hypothetical protein